MNSPKQNKLLILVLILTCCGIASSQSAKVVQSLPEDSFIVSIDGKDYRAVNADKVREIEKTKLDLEAAQKVNAEQIIQIRELTLQRDLADSQKALVQQKADSLEADSKRHEADAARNYGLFIGERTLRQEASQFIPKGNAHGFWGKTLDFLNSQQAQVGFKLVMPTAQAIKVFSARCPQ